ncbi:AAA family ATPase [Sodalinema gerasimenkoae]|uniref:AAA family ATPase n=1 Tax=Sodalinema gerasimenkoae TaxID=2862348 RepID=UPI00135B392F|nr:AAA family ATPase [Sodalinema gerasimenkoae]
MQWIDFQQTLNQRLQEEQLDEEQTQARNFSPNGHSLVRGAVGSGKSLVLRDRVSKVLEQDLNSVLVLSYNRFMRFWLESSLKKQGCHVECGTFHGWSARHFDYKYRDDKEKESRKQLIKKAQDSNLSYDAILIDEAQDFYDEWFQTLLGVLNPDTNSLFFVYDNTQSVYGQSHRRNSGWTWKQLGIDVVGRSQIFDVNYRNSPEILELSWHFIQPALENVGLKSDKRENSPPIDRVIEPKKKGDRSSGLSPSLIQMNFSDMPEEIAKQVKQALEGCPESSIGILTHRNSRELRVKISEELAKLEVNHNAPKSSQERSGNVVNRPYVIVDSWNAVKGVEFDAVILAGVDLVLGQHKNPDRAFEEMAGLYTAITRSKDHLIMLYQDKNPVIEQLENALTAEDQLMVV